VSIILSMFVSCNAKEIKLQRQLHEAWLHFGTVKQTEVDAFSIHI
jgi:hypothetical protein